MVRLAILNRNLSAELERARIAVPELNAKVRRAGYEAPRQARRRPSEDWGRATS